MELEELRDRLRRHAGKLRERGIKARPRPGELAEVDLEEEFDN